LREIDWLPSKLYKSLDKAVTAEEKDLMLQKLRKEINASIDNSLSISIVDHSQPTLP